MFDEKIAKEYVDKSGCFCPYCGSNNLSADYMEVNGSCAWRRIDCLNPECLMEWNEIYHLVDIEK